MVRKVQRRLIEIRGRQTETGEKKQVDEKAKGLERRERHSFVEADAAWRRPIRPEGRVNARLEVFPRSDGAFNVYVDPAKRGLFPSAEHS